MKFSYARRVRRAFRGLWKLATLLSLALGTWAALIGMILLVAACQTTGSAATRTPASDACLVFQPIRWSKADTRDTQEQAVAHNAAWKSLCAHG